MASDATVGPAATNDDLRFRRLRLKNWKNFLEVDIPVHDRMFLVGANGSGKSNLLDAFRFLRDVASPGGFQSAVARRQGVEAIRSLAAVRDAEVGIEVEVEGERGGPLWRYGLSFCQDTDGQPRLRSEHVSHDGRAIVERPDSDDNTDGDLLRQTFLEQVSRSRPFRHLEHFFRTVASPSVVPEVIREPGGTLGDFREQHGGRFVEEIAGTPTDERDLLLGRIERALRTAVPHFDSLSLVRDSGGKPHLAIRHTNWLHDDSWQTENQCSDGMLRLIGLLWTLLKANGPVLLEEPESSIHPDVVRMLPQMLEGARQRSRRQVFLSTHSPNLMWDDGIGLEETLLLLTNGANTRAVTAESVEEVCALVEGGLSVAEAAIPQTQPNGTWLLGAFADD